MTVLRWLGCHPGLIVLAAVLAVAVPAAAGYHRPHPPDQATAPLSWADTSPAGIRGPLAAVLADQRQADRGRREAWITDGYSGDLATLAAATEQAYGSDQLSGAEWRFSQDAQDYLTAAGNTATAPPPGWQPHYAQIRADVNALALAAGLAPVPAPGYPVSGQAVPVHPWSAPAGGACTSTATHTASSSDTGASSQSASVRVKCGTSSATTTNRTSVSATGKVTRTRTVTTSG